MHIIQTCTDQDSTGFILPHWWSWRAGAVLSCSALDTVTFENIVCFKKTFEILQKEKTKLSVC